MRCDCCGTEIDADDTDAATRGARRDERERGNVDRLVACGACHRDAVAMYERAEREARIPSDAATDTGDF